MNARQDQPHLSGPNRLLQHALLVVHAANRLVTTDLSQALTFEGRLRQISGVDDATAAKVGFPPNHSGASSSGVPADAGRALVNEATEGPCLRPSGSDP